MRILQVVQQLQCRSSWLSSAQTSTRSTSPGDVLAISVITFCRQARSTWQAHSPAWSGPLEAGDHLEVRHVLASGISLGVGGAGLWAVEDTSPYVENWTPAIDSGGYNSELKARGWEEQRIAQRRWLRPSRIYAPHIESQNSTWLGCIRQRKRMVSFDILEQPKEPRFLESDVFVNKSFRRLVEVLAPYVMRRIWGTELFDRRRENLIERGSLIPDLLRFLRTMVPTERDVQNYVHAEYDWDNYFSELGIDARNSAESIIRFRNHNWAHLYGYDDYEVRRCLWHIRTLLDSVYRAQQFDSTMSDLVVNTAEKFDQVQQMWSQLGTMLDGGQARVGPLLDPRGQLAAPYSLVPTTPTLTGLGTSLPFPANLVPGQSDLVSALQSPPGTFTPSDYQRGQADLMLGQARMAASLEDFHVAVASFEAVRPFYGDSRYDEEYAAAVYGRGRHHVKDRKYELAKADFELALTLDSALGLQPEDASPYHNEANEKFFDGLHEESIRLFNCAIELNPEGTADYSVTRKTRRATGGQGSHSGKFNRGRLWEIYHDRGRAYLEIGHSLSAAGSFDVALENYESAIVDFDESDRVGRRPREDNELARRIAELSIAVGSSPNDVGALVDRARACTNGGHYDLALADLDRARQLHQGLDCSREYRDMYANLGDAFFGEGESIQMLEDDDNCGWEAFECAIENYTMALGICGQDPSILQARGNAYHSIQENALAVLDYQRALYLNPDCDGNFVDPWGRTYDFDRVQCLFEKGQAQAATKDRDNLLGAVRAFEEILSVDWLGGFPDCGDDEAIDMGIEVCYELGNAQSLQGNTDVAIRSYTRGMSATSPEGPWLDLWINRGNAHFRNEEYDAALRDFDTVLDQNPGDYSTAHVRKLRGQAYAELGELDNAISDYDKYLFEFGRDGEVARLREIAVHLRDQSPGPEPP